MIVFHVAMGFTSGLGHLNRCITLAKKLHFKSKLCFLIPTGNKVSVEILQKKKLPFVFFDPNNGLLDIVTIVPIETCTIVVDLSDQVNVNNPQLLVDYFHKIKTKGIKLVVIDGLFSDRILSKNFPTFDILVQPYIEEEDIVENNTNNHLKGSKYVILDENYINKIDKVLSQTKKIAKSILISFGGSDPTLLTNYFSKLIKENKKHFAHQVFTIVLGPYMSEVNKSSIQSTLADVENVFLRTDVTEMKFLFKQADVAILSSGATSRYEAAACGVPVLFVSSSKNHDYQCKLYENYSCAKFLGNQEALKKDELLNDLISFINNQELRSRMRDATLNLVDGCGAWRIAEEILMIGSLE